MGSWMKIEQLSISVQSFKLIPRWLQVHAAHGGLFHGGSRYGG